ncbi:NnrU nitric oxide reduction family protein [Nitzschia inconspicua]|uniref:NnrU nitric oxide reduction family protein n=1 Tax=Nitzschia inconspicua TaxID=303405 RepID=A0A9K3KK39_9STRA|nr:NnrU nitric oxide reduction family protein [Nitzschia inconspicua]
MSFLVSAASRKSPLLRWAVGGWTFFILENTVLSENRTYLIDRLGDDQYHAVYGTCSTLASVSIGYAYWKIRTAKSIPSSLILWNKNARPPLVHLAVAWTCFSLGLVMASQVAPKLQIPVSIASQNGATQFQVRCPFDFSDKHHGNSSNPFDTTTVRGLERITRHPGLWSFGFIGLGQSLLAWNVPLRIWWMGPTAVAWLGGWHTDSRFRRGMGGTLTRSYDAQTSNVPFLAMIRGQQGTGCWEQLFLHEIKPLNAAIGIAASSLWILKKIR